MYKIFADDTLIYDSTIEDYKIGKGTVTLETNKSGSFVFSLYPDHFYYDKFVRLKTIITVYKRGRIVFRGRILNDVTNHWNNKVFTCEGELSFLQDSIIRPFSFGGTPEELFTKFITEHNAQVEDSKKFKIGTVTVAGSGKYIGRYTTLYESTLTNLNERLVNSSLGGYFYITHGEDGTDPIPTIHYLAAFTKVATQMVEFGANLKKYTKTVKADSIATAIIPLGATVDDGDSSTEDKKLTIADVNGGKDYVYSAAGVALYGWIFKVVEWNDVTNPETLKANAEAYVEGSVQQNVTIELTAIDLHLVNRSIESFNICDYIRVVSAPHNFDSTLLCNKQTLDLLKPDNDSIVLGYTYSTFTERNNKISASITNVVNMSANVTNLTNKVLVFDRTVVDTEQAANSALQTSQSVSAGLDTAAKDLEAVAGVAAENSRSIMTNATNIANNAEAIQRFESKSPVWGIHSEGVIVASGTVGEAVVTFPTPFAVAPSVVIATPHVITAGASVEVTIREITATGFVASIKNEGEYDLTVRIMYVAYPQTEEVV